MHQVQKRVWRSGDRGISLAQPAEPAASLTSRSMRCAASMIGSRQRAFASPAAPAGRRTRMRPAPRRLLSVVRAQQGGATKGQLLEVAQRAAQEATQVFGPLRQCHFSVILQACAGRSMFFACQWM